MGPKCQGAAARDWLAERQAELLPVGYFHLVFTLPAEIADLAYLSRYTHRVAISNSRLIALKNRSVTFRVKDYRRNGHERIRSMTLDPGEFIRRFLLHVLPPMDGQGTSTASATSASSPAPGSPRVLSLEAFGRRPTAQLRTHLDGPASETLHRDGHCLEPDGMTAL